MNDLHGNYAVPLLWINILMCNIRDHTSIFGLNLSSSIPIAARSPDPKKTISGITLQQMNWPTGMLKLEDVQYV